MVVGTAALRLFSKILCIVPGMQGIGAAMPSSEALPVAAACMASYLDDCARRRYTGVWFTFDADEPSLGGIFARGL